MILLDYSAILHPNVYMNKETIIENPKFVAHLMLTQIDLYMKKFGASRQNPMVICLDSPSWRKDYYIENRSKFEGMEEMEYKGNRKKDPDMPWDEIYKVNEELCSCLSKYSDIFVLKVDKAEADDIIATISKKRNDTIWIISPDKDFVQCIKDNVHIYDFRKNIFKTDMNIDVFKKVHIISGDASDNIPPIRKRWGEKTALKKLKELDDLLATDPELRERYEFNEKLICLDKIPEYISDKVMKELEQQEFNFNTINLMKEFMKLNLSKFSENINSFKLPTDEVKTKLNQFFKNTESSTLFSDNSLEDLFN